MKLDRETTEHMRKGEVLRDFVQSEGWNMAKDLLMERIKVLDSVSSIPTDMSLEEIGKQAMFRAHAISLIQDWIDAIEARVEQHTEQQKLVAEVRAEEVIRTYSSSS